MFLLADSYREEQSGDGWRLYAGPLVVEIRATIVDPQMRKELCASLLAVYRRLESFWEISPQTPVEIHLETDADGLQLLTGLRISHCIPSRRRVYLEPSSSLGHELSHVVAYAFNPQRDKLLDEGAATVLNQRDSRLFIDWRASRDADDVNLDALFAPGAEFPLSSCQYIAGSFVAHVLRAWGRSAFLALFRTALRNTDSIRPSLPVSWEDLIREWRRDLKRVKRVASLLEVIASRARHVPDHEFLRDLASIENVLGDRTELRVLRLRALFRRGDLHGAATVGRELLAAVDERSDCPATLVALYDTMARLERAWGGEARACCYHRKAAHICTATAVQQLLPPVAARELPPSARLALGVLDSPLASPSPERAISRSARRDPDGDDE